jgi:asparagine synthase (glutamine-hydrolysing)
MCGILCSNLSRIEKPEFLRALGLMEHRGPDAAGGYLALDQFQLGHNRLKIIDLDDRSNQPFVSRNGRYVMVYNGEVYNYRDLARRFGVELRTTSDTEVLVELYDRLGTRMLQHLNGMFAFVILDRATRELFAARDRLGVKPLYMYRGEGGFIFSSEIAPIVSLLPRVEPDLFALRQYRKLRTFFNNRTAYRGIEMFPAGHFLNRGRLTRYWDLPCGEQTPPGDEELAELISSAVELRLISDVPVGSYLSGGLDSTVVAALARKPHTWTVGFSEENEFPWAQEAAQALSAIHTEVLVDREDFLRTASAMIRARREPLSVPNEVLLYLMTREVKRCNTVVLSGEGADELFLGYDRIFRWAADCRNWDLGEFSRLYSYGSHDDLEVVEDAVSPFYRYGEPLAVVAAFFQVAHLHGLLRRLDDATMRCSVEARVPFVDYRLVERLAETPFAYRKEGGVVKAPLKRVAASMVPRSIIEREKVGFPVDLNRIFGLTGSRQAGLDAWFSFNLRELDMEVIK